MSATLYAVALLFRGAEDDDDAPLWEERAYLIMADSEEMALESGIAVGRAEETEYLGVGGKIVKWRYEGVLGIHEPDDRTLSQGTEVFARPFSSREVEAISGARKN